MFQCQMKTEGTDTQDMIVRLCLEFSDNKNMFFYGEVDDEGNCNINIPQLTELKNKEGRLTVEAIADAMYFKLYEAEVELKNSVEIKMETTLTKKEPAKQNIELEAIIQEDKKDKKEPEEEPEEEPKEDDKPKKKGWESLRNKPVPSEPKTDDKKPPKKDKGGLKSFADWQKNK